MYYIIYRKSFPSFAMHKKRFSLLFLFKFVPQQILNFLFMFHFVKLIASKFRQRAQFLSINFSRDSFCLKYFDVTIRHQLNKKFKGELIRLNFSFTTLTFLCRKESVEIFQEAKCVSWILFSLFTQSIFIHTIIITFHS